MENSNSDNKFSTFTQRAGGHARGAKTRVFYSRGTRANANVLKLVEAREFTRVEYLENSDGTDLALNLTNDEKKGVKISAGGQVLTPENWRDFLRDKEVDKLNVFYEGETTIDEATLKAEAEAESK